MHKLQHNYSIFLKKFVKIYRLSLVGQKAYKKFDLKYYGAYIEYFLTNVF